MSDPVLILGATGAIGGEISGRLCSDSPLILHGRSGGRLQSLSDKLSKQGGEIDFFRADLTVSAEVESLFDQILMRHSGLSGVVFSVAQPFVNKLTHNTPWTSFTEQLDSQLKAFHLTMQHAFTLLKKKEENGSRVLVLSTEFVLGSPPMKTASYVSAKAALTAYATVLAKEWLRHDIRVHILAPGMVRSSMTAEMPDRYIEQLEDGMPEKRLTSLKDVADLAEFLMSSKADTLYGTVVHASRAERR